MIASAIANNWRSDMEVTEEWVRESMRRLGKSRSDLMAELSGRTKIDQGCEKVRSTDSFLLMVRRNPDGTSTYVVRAPWQSVYELFSCERRDDDAAAALLAKIEREVYRVSRKERRFALLGKILSRF